VGVENDGKGERLAAHRADERRRCDQRLGEGWHSEGGGGREGNGGGERGDGLLRGPSVHAEEEKGWRATTACSRPEQRERENGGKGSGYSGAVGRRGKGGPGAGGAWSGGHRGWPDSDGCGRLPTTWNRGREGERGVRRCGWRVGRLRGVGPSCREREREREREVREGDKWGRL
jgi:hypothetical protein